MTGPIEGLVQHMMTSEYPMIFTLEAHHSPSFTFRGCTLSIMPKSYEIFGEHVVYCRKQSRFKYRPDMIKDVLHDVL